MTNKDKVVQVYFKERGDSEFITGPYSFLCNYKVKLGDLVICDTKYGPNLGQVTKIVSMTQLYKNADIKPAKRIISIVNLDNYYEEKQKALNEEKRNKILTDIANLQRQVETLKSQYNSLL